MCRLAAKTPLIGQSESIHKTDVCRSVQSIQMAKTEDIQTHITHSESAAGCAADSLKDPGLINVVKCEAQTLTGSH